MSGVPVVSAAPVAAQVAQTAPLVCCLSHPFIRAGWPTIDATLLSLDDAIERSWATDEHAQQGYSRRSFANPAPSRLRASSETIAEHPFVATVVMFDLDPPSHVATDEWRAENRAALTECLAATGGYAPSQPGVDCIKVRAGTGRSFETRNGARLIFELAQPVEITDAHGAARWRQAYLGTCSELQRYGLNADASCADFGRLFRLARVVRTEGNEHPVARHVVPVYARAAAPSWRPDPADLSPVMLGVSQHGPIFDRLLPLGHVHAEMSRGKSRRRWWIRCPFQHQHGGRTGAPYGDCVFHAPDEPCGIGWIHCYHAACVDRDQADFRAAIRDAARRALPAAEPDNADDLAILNARDGYECDDALLTLRSGRDQWSNTKGAELLAAVRAKSSGDELLLTLAKHICTEPGNLECVPRHRHSSDACRWFLRGLRWEHALRRATLRQEGYPQ